jgi:hypothetical protein
VGKVEFFGVLRCAQDDSKTCRGKSDREPATAKATADFSTATLTMRL